MFLVLRGKSRNSGMSQSPIIFIDADGCAVKDEVYRVATRYQLRVILVANKRIAIPSESNQNLHIEMVVVPGGLDIADDWITENISAGDIAITADIPLANRCIQKQARVLGPKGDEFTEENIGSILASRDLLTHLRGAGQITGGPAPMEKRDRSKFLSSLDRIIQSVKRK